MKRDALQALACSPSALESSDGLHRGPRLLIKTSTHNAQQTTADAAASDDAVFYGGGGEAHVAVTPWAAAGFSLRSRGSFLSVLWTVAI